VVKTARGEETGNIDNDVNEIADEDDADELSVGRATPAGEGN
jgi:hypothetical protein